MSIVFSIAILMTFSGVIFKKLQTNSVTEPFLALIFGIMIGPDVLNLIKSAPQKEEFEILKIACEFTIAIALMATALRLPQKFFKKNLTTQSNLVVFGMILMWLSSAVVAYLVLPSLSFPECLLLGAIVTPTDPVVASTLTTGKTAKEYLPGFLRNSLSFEAGVNDGLAYPIVFLSLFMAGAASFGFEEWFTRVLLYENILCAILAYIAGKGAGSMMKKGHKAGLMSNKSLFSYSLAVTFVLLAGFNLLKMNGIIAVFVGGYAFAQDLTNHEDLEEEKVQDAMERITTIPVFFILGLVLPWQEWYLLGWSAVVLVLLILFLRRLPALLILMPALPLFRSKIYSGLLMGWFGPIGVATLYYAIHMKEKSGLEEVWVIPSLLVVASTIIHGLTSVPLEKLYFRKAGRANEFS
ncbi:cation:proton antiporter domain-containing protein [Salinimicrobium marinum]|nr:cation:proton antiporter [Salinimicrobium marinum]